jgi:MFS family permease
MSSTAGTSATATLEHAPPVPAASSTRQAEGLRGITKTQWKSGIAAWLGWMFDGLDMHLYTVVALPFVAELLGASRSAEAGYYASWIQASFLIGWAVGGAVFGRIGDRIGRSRALVLTILMYALFTGLSFFAQTWWHLLIFRFLAALGIGGEWAVGASLLCETWPKRWRPWIAATLQSAVNIGVLFAMVATVLLSGFPYRYVFLVGVIPALLVVWIRKAVPEPEEWHAARAAECDHPQPAVGQLFRGAIRRTTLLTIAVCSFSLTAHWAFMFWSLQHLGTLPGVKEWDPKAISRFKMYALVVLMVASIVGNFIAGAIAKRTGYRFAIVVMCVAYFAAMAGTYAAPRDYRTLFNLMWVLGACQGLFGLFTMYLPPLFPTLLRTTGAGFCYNIGRIAAALGTVYFGTLAARGGVHIDYRLTLLYASFLFLPAAVAVMFMSEPPDENPPVTVASGRDTAAVAT